MSDACCCFVCVRTQEVGVVEDLGQFKKLLDPGLHCITYPLQSIVGRMSLRIQQLDVLCETKTKDNVFVQVGVAVQYRVLVDGAYDAYYRLTDPRNQIQSYGKIYYCCSIEAVLSLTTLEKDRKIKDSLCYYLKYCCVTKYLTLLTLLLIFI